MQTNFNNKLDKQIIQKEWQKLFGKSAPTGCHSSFLEKALAWQRQNLAQGGLSASERRRLLGEVTAENANAGTRLVRVWQGETHQVTVLADGYLYQDQHWKSLSAIAKAITGTPWSGPVFFGVKK
jgi:hypothetical protein